MTYRLIIMALLPTSMGKKEVLWIYKQWNSYVVTIYIYFCLALFSFFSLLHIPPPMTIFIMSPSILDFMLLNIKNKPGGFPGGTVVRSLPANAGDTGSSPGLGRSHMPRSNWAREPQLLSLRVWSLCSETREAAIVRGPHTVMKSGPHSPQLEKALAQKRRPNTVKNK